MRMSRFRRAVAILLAVCLSGAGIVPSYGGIVSSETVVVGAAHNHVASVLQRSEVRTHLQAMGVDPSEVQARVAALSDEEAAQLAARLDELPAGGDVLGVLVFVFLVLLFTDIMGWTKVFPFTRPAQTSK
jgi:hypothetical protein